MQELSQCTQGKSHGMATTKTQASVASTSRVYNLGAMSHETGRALIAEWLIYG